MAKETKKFNRNCQFFITDQDAKKKGISTEDFKYRNFIDIQYSKLGENQVQIKYIKGSRCSKKIQIKRGAHPLCKKHCSEKYGAYLKEQRKLYRETCRPGVNTKRIDNEEQKQLHNEKFFASENRSQNKNKEASKTESLITNNFELLMLIPGIIIFALVFIFTQDGFTVDRIIERPTTESIVAGSPKNEIIVVGQTTRSWEYPILRKLLIAIWLCFPTYYLLIYGAIGDKPISSLIFNALYYLFTGFLFMVAAYFILGLFGSALGI